MEWIREEVVGSLLTVDSVALTDSQKLKDIEESLIKIIKQLPDENKSRDKTN